MKKTQFKGVAMLMVTAIIWGSAFVAQSVGMESVGAFTFNGIRTVLGGLVLLPVVLVRDRREAAAMDDAQRAEKRLRDRRTLLWGILLGIVFCAAGNVQQFAFRYSSAGKIAFITALYMFFVPLFGLVLKKRVAPITWGCVVMGFVGLYFLSIGPGGLGAVNRGDVLTVICAALFAVHILMVERFSREADGVRLSMIQFFTSGIISCLLMLVFETPRLPDILTAAVPILYAGVLSCGVAYTFQILGQRYTEATVASLLMCTEAVFGVLFGALILHERLTGREILGCAIMFSAILLSQLSDTVTERLRQRKRV